MLNNLKGAIRELSVKAAVQCRQKFEQNFTITFKL